VQFNQRKISVYHLLSLILAHRFSGLRILLQSQSV